MEIKIIIKVLKRKIVTMSKFKIYFKQFFQHLMTESYKNINFTKNKMII
jgi:hypothetical protein